MVLGRFRAWWNYDLQLSCLHVLVIIVWDDPPSQVTKTPQESFTFCRDSFRETGEPTSSGCLNRSPWKHLFFPQVMCASPPWPTCCPPWCGASGWEFGIPKCSNAVADGEIHSLKLTKPLKMGDPKRNCHLPTIHVQGRAVKLRGVFHWFGTYPLRM